MSLVVTMPGTLTNVTPEMLAPTMPKATSGHGDRRPARKKSSFVPRPVSREMPNRRAK